MIAESRIKRMILPLLKLKNCFIGTKYQRTNKRMFEDVRLSEESCEDPKGNNLLKVGA